MVIRKMWRISLLAFILLPMLTACQGPLFQNLFKEQEWSENYALADGAKCTSPEMIDGDLNTAGKTVFPEKVYGRTFYGAFPSAEAEITLPEKKSIRKIVIYSQDLSKFEVLASTGERGDWQLVKEFDSNSEKRIVIRTSVFADKIKIRARAKTAPAEGVERGVVRGAIVALRTRSAQEPEIEEIELYGYKSVAPEAPEQEQKPNTGQAKESFF